MFSDHGIVFNLIEDLVLFDGETMKTLPINTGRYAVNSSTVVFVPRDESQLYRYHLGTGKTVSSVYLGNSWIYSDGVSFCFCSGENLFRSSDGIDWEKISNAGRHIQCYQCGSIMWYIRWQPREYSFDARTWVSIPDDMELRYLDEDVMLTVDEDRRSTINGSITYEKGLLYVGKRDDVHYFHSFHDVIAVKDGQTVVIQSFDQGIYSALLNDVALVVGTYPHGTNGSDCYWTTDFVRWHQRPFCFHTKVSGGYILVDGEILFHPRWRIGVRLLPAFRRKQRNVLLAFRRCGVPFVLFYQVRMLY